MPVTGVCNGIGIRWGWYMSCMSVTGVCNGVCISSLLTCSSLSPSPSPACSRAIASSSLVFSSYACESVMPSYVHKHLHTTILPSYYLPLSCWGRKIPTLQSSYLAVGLELLFLSLQVFIHGNQCTQLLQNTGGGQHTPNIQRLEQAKWRLRCASTQRAYSLFSSVSMAFSFSISSAIFCP